MCQSNELANEHSIIWQGILQPKSDSVQIKKNMMKLQQRFLALNTYILQRCQYIMKVH